MGFLSRAFRNRGLIENLSRDPVARIEPIAPLLNPIGSFPQIPQQPIVPIRPLPIEEPIVPLPLPVDTPIPGPLEQLPFESPRDDFLSIQRLDDPIMRPLPVGPSIPFVPPPQPPVTLPVSPVQARRQELENLGYDAADVQEILERDQVRGLGNITSNVLPPVTPPIAPPPVNIGGPPLDTSLIPQREILERPIIPPRRDDFMSIERLDEPIREIDPPSITDTTPPPLVDPVVITPPVTPEPVIESAPTTPAAVATDVGAVPTTTIPQDVRGQVDPVLAQQDTVEMQTDPLLRALYFGTADQPGFINQLQQATANLIGSDVPLQQTAGLSELEQLAQDRAISDLGVAEPFVGESADLIRGTTRQFDPSMTQQFFNPFEDQVVQQTIQDVLEAGEKRDIAQRARDIQTGGLSAFGSRARLTAADRQEALGKGLAEALGGIRQAGFGQAQRDALSTFAQQRQAEQQAARDIGQVGSTLADLRARERAGLVGFGQTGRSIEETGLSRLFQQQVDAQGRPLQALQLTGSLLPQFQAGSTRIDSQYRLPTDPSAAGLGAAFNAYAALAPKQGVG
jgi:hypothetical protein